MVLHEVYSAHYGNVQFGLGADYCSATYASTCSTPVADVPTTKIFPSFQPDGPVLGDPEIESGLLATERRTAKRGECPVPALTYHHLGKC